MVGATGVWKYDKLEPALRPEQGILGLRREMKVFANLRPAFLYDERVGSSPLKPEKVRGLDILIARELNGDAYFGQPRGMRKAPRVRRPARGVQHHALQRAGGRPGRARRLQGGARA
jgi:3-isopropylmalate dehydrogenase